jgi:hypothetical protein
MKTKVLLSDKRESEEQQKGPTIDMGNTLGGIRSL